MDSAPERQPDFLEQDSPSVKGESYLYHVDPMLFTLKAQDIKDSTLAQIPRTPRSPRMNSMLQTLRLKEMKEESQEKQKKIDVKARMKFIDDARTASLNGTMTPKPKMEFHGVPAEGVIGTASVSTDAKQFLNNENSSKKKKKAVGRKEQMAEKKLDEYRQSVELGTLSIRDLQHRSPGRPKPSHTRPVIENKEKEVIMEVEEEGPREIPILKILLSAGLARLFYENLASKFRSKVITHKYEEDLNAMHEIVRLQRWIRHQRVKSTFFKLLRHRRIVIKAITMYVRRFKKRYKHKCSAMVLNFFTDCFKVGRFRMAIKVFCYRVVRTQRCVRSFLACNRARNASLCLKVKAMSEELAGDDNRKLKTIKYIAHHHATEAINTLIIKKYRFPYMRERAEYYRCIKAGDMNKAFKELEWENVQAFLRADNKSDQPPQFDGGIHTLPTFKLFSRRNLKDDFKDLIRKVMGDAIEHDKRMQAEAKERRKQEELDEAFRKGHGQAYQLKLMKEQNAKEVNPKVRMREAAEELSYFKKKMDKQGTRLEAEVKKVSRMGERARKKEDAELKSKFHRHSISSLT